MGDCQGEGAGEANWASRCAGECDMTVSLLASAASLSDVILVRPGN